MAAATVATLTAAQRSEIVHHARRLAQRHRDGALSDAQFAALYFLTWQITLHGSRFAARRYKADPRADVAQWRSWLWADAPSDLTERLLTLLERYQFLGVTHEVGAALSAWLRGRWSLILLHHVPPPSEVLRMQIGGVRPVSVLCDAQRMFEPIFEKADAFVFVQHDLEHAFRFFSDPELHRMQRNFFCLIERVTGAGVLRDMLGEALFRDRFHYLISDMNTHPLHSLQYLRAILVEQALRAEHRGPQAALSTRARDAIAHVFATLCSHADFVPVEQAAMMRMAHGQFCVADAALIESALRREPVPRCEPAAVGMY